MADTLQSFVTRIRGAVARGEGAAARQALADAIGKSEDPALRRAAAILLIEQGDYGIADVTATLEAVVATDPQDSAALQALAMAQWVRDQRDLQCIVALDTARRLVARSPLNGGALRLLGMIALTKRAYLESYLAFSAAAVANPPLLLEAARRLAALLMRGVDHVTFSVEGQKYDFGLTVHTTQAMESSIAHCAGALTEMEELRYLKNQLGQANVIVEVGVLLGNHSAYFLKNLGPQRLYAFEADPSCLPEIRRNLDANNPGGIETVVRNLFVGVPDGAPVEIAGVMVPQAGLSSLVSERVDFIKIDVDGGEMSALAGAEALITASRPFVMIETEIVTDLQVRDWFLARGYELRHRIGHSNYFNNFFAPSDRPQTE